MKQLLFIPAALLVIACNTSIEKQVTTPALPPEPVKIDIMALQEQKAHIDSLFKYASEHEINIYVKQKEKQDLVLVAAKHFPENIESTITIFKDNSGHVIRISESPTCDTGDWFISCNHYFDEAGKTFAFEKKTNSFNSHCVEGVLYETKTEYFDGKLSPVDYTYKLLDENDRHVVQDSCDIFQYNYRVQPDVETYLTLKAIKQKPPKI